MKNKLVWGILLAIVIGIGACSPKTKKVTIENKKPLVISGIGSEKDGMQVSVSIMKDFVLLYDVEVAMNGVDFGVIEGGSEPITKEVPDANNLKIEKFNILRNDQGLAVYYKDQNDKKIYMDFSNEVYAKFDEMKRCETDMSKMEAKFKKVDQAGGLLNDSWKWDVSYGENGNKLANQAKEQQQKNKKKK